jgi:predicted ester cyclase
MNGHNWAVGSEFIADDCESKLLSYFMTSWVRGSEGWLIFVKVLQAGFPDFKIIIDEELAEDDIVVIKWTFLGTNNGILMGYPASGMPVSFEGTTWYRIADGQIMENVVNMDQFAQLVQTGIGRMPLEKYKASEYNKAIMYQLFNGVWNKKDYSLIDQYVAEDMLQHSPGEGSGREGFRETVKKYHAAFSDMNFIIEDEMADADMVTHRFRWECTHTGTFNGIPATGRRVSFTGTVIVRVSNGQMAEHWSNVDAMSLLIQLGVIPASS